MPEEVERKTLLFRVIEREQWAYILWPWDTPESFLYEMLNWGATYQTRAPIQLKLATWIELRSDQGTHGEYEHLMFGLTRWGYAPYRRFNARHSHAITHHALDCIAKAMWNEAYEVDPGMPTGDIRFQFRVNTARKVFTVSFCDWLEYFASGQNGHISTLAKNNPEEATT